MGVRQACCLDLVGQWSLERRNSTAAHHPQSNTCQQIDALSHRATDHFLLGYTNSLQLEQGYGSSRSLAASSKGCLLRHNHYLPQTKRPHHGGEVVQLRTTSLHSHLRVDSTRNKVVSARNRQRITETQADTTGLNPLAVMRLAASRLTDRLTKPNALRSIQFVDNHLPNAEDYHAILEINDQLLKARQVITNRTNVFKILKQADIATASPSSFSFHFMVHMPDHRLLNYDGPRYQVPSLVVVLNSTFLDWRREIKQEIT